MVCGGGGGVQDQIGCRYVFVYISGGVYMLLQGQRVRRIAESCILHVLKLFLLLLLMILFGKAG